MNAIIKEIMQLPRGTFREIQKNRETHNLLVELERGHFSGICSISKRDSICTLVLKSGKCILAECNSFKGDAAFEDLLDSLAGETVDAALSTLDEQQIQLSLEFNKAERIAKATYNRPAPRKSTPHTVVPAQRVLIKKTDIIHEKNLSPPHEEVATLVAHSSEKIPRRLAGPQNPVTGPPPAIRLERQPGPKEPEIPEKNTEKTDFDNDLDILDSMNLDQVKDKIRDDCKTMVKHLHLDHLMDKD
ncbi:hypothetical protein [Methanoregula sp.]|uniref:hypothetical protein n=2 Tax=Methanoregula sp. TaxID=2052170 RepID=UPI003C5F892F